MNNKNLPLISIQILNWNRAEEVIKAIQSAIEQSYSNIEVVVIDNGSTDNSVELIKKNYQLSLSFKTMVMVSLSQRKTRPLTAK